MSDQRTNSDIIADLKNSFRLISNYEEELNNLIINDTSNFLDTNKKEILKIMISNALIISKNFNLDENYFKLLKNETLKRFSDYIKFVEKLNSDHGKQQLGVSFQNVINNYTEIFIEIDNIKLNSIIKNEQNLLEKTKENYHDLITKLQKQYSGNEIENQSSKFRRTCIYYIIISGILIGVIALILCAGYKIYDDNFKNYIEIEDKYQFLHYISNKFIIFGTLLYGISFSSKNLMACIHNFAINKQKQNALETYKIFIDSTTSEDKKDIILTYAANCIYSHQETGFNNKSSSGGSNPAEQIAKIAEAIVKAAPKETK